MVVNFFFQKCTFNSSCRQNFIYFENVINITRSEKEPVRVDFDPLQDRGRLFRTGDVNV